MQPNARMLFHPAHFLSLGFGSGLAPIAPGTFGTLAAMPLYWTLMSLDLTVYLVVVLVLGLLGIALCAYTAKVLGVHDHSAIVWDEVVGYLITMAAAPAGWVWWLGGFVLFRLFDILKPWPIRWIDRRVHGGLGIMLDDVLAGLLAWAGLQAAAILTAGVG